MSWRNVFTLTKVSACIVVTVFAIAGPRIVAGAAAHLDRG